MTQLPAYFPCQHNNCRGIVSVLADLKSQVTP